MNKEEKRQAQEQQARERAVHGSKVSVIKPPEFKAEHWAIHRQLDGTCGWCSEVERWTRDQAEAGAIRAFLDGGPCPPDYRRLYDLAREQLRLGPKDWYEAFADAAHGLVPGWDATMELTQDQESYCEAAADSVAIRPEAEK